MGTRLDFLWIKLWITRRNKQIHARPCVCTRTPSSRQNSNRATILVIKLAGVLGCGHNHIAASYFSSSPYLQHPNTIALSLFQPKSNTQPPKRGGGKMEEGESQWTGSSQLTHNTSSGFQFYKEGWYQGNFAFQPSCPKWRKGWGGPRRSTTQYVLEI